MCYTTLVHYTTLQYTTLHYSTLHYTTVHYTTHVLHYTGTPLHYTTLHMCYTTLVHYTTLHYTTLHYTRATLHMCYTKLHSNPRPTYVPCSFASGSKVRCNTLHYQHYTFFFSFLFFFHLTYSRWTSSLPSCLWSQTLNIVYFS